MNITFINVMWCVAIPLFAVFGYLCYLEFRQNKPGKAAIAIAGVFALWLLAGLFRPAKPVDGFEVQEFGSLPVLQGGRVQPLDSIARNSLLSIRGKSSIALTDVAWWERFIGRRPETLKATPWLMEVFFKPELADDRPLFLVHHPEVKSELGLSELRSEKGKERKFFSYNEITSKTQMATNRMTGEVSGEPVNFDVLRTQASRIGDIDAQLRTPLDKQFMNLHNSLGMYLALKGGLGPPNTADWLQEVNAYARVVPVGMALAQNMSQLTPEQERELQVLSSLFQRYQRLQEMEERAPLRAMPPVGVPGTSEEWSKPGGVLLESLRAGEVHPAVMAYAKMGQAFRDKEPAVFNQEVGNYRSWLAGRSFVAEQEKGRTEFLFNSFGPFYKSMVIYVVALLLGLFFWLNFTPWVRQAGFWLIALALIVHTAGLIFRMQLEGRPPVTNLYSSAVFIGWGAVGLCLVLERIFKDGIGIVVASTVGFSTLIIAHHLSITGDTMEMLEAVLDTNFWLATHVVAVTIGYAAMFVAGFLAIIYIFRGMFTRSLTRETSNSLKRMVYGIVCFATLFSFVGTVLGGIWADQSWGRFWGWDPKENGALMIVIWCAMTLHARWGGMIKERGLMGMAVFGNIITAFSWFGVNMLGVGLHSYGFMDKAMFWLVGFTISQLVIVALCFVPTSMWLSFKKPTPPGLPTTGTAKAAPAV